MSPCRSPSTIAAYIVIFGAGFMLLRRIVRAGPQVAVAAETAQGEDLRRTSRRDRRDRCRRRPKPPLRARRTGGGH